MKCELKNTKKTMLIYHIWITHALHTHTSVKVGPRARLENVWAHFGADLAVSSEGLLRLQRPVGARAAVHAYSCHCGKLKDDMFVLRRDHLNQTIQSNQTNIIIINNTNNCLLFLSNVLYRETNHHPAGKAVDESFSGFPNSNG